MQPRRSHGRTAEQRTRMCESKHRWCDEFSARAGAIHCLERYTGATQLFIYKCPICAGWHLTRRPQQGQEPITLGQP